MKIPEEAVIETLEANNAYRARTLDQTGQEHAPPSTRTSTRCESQVIAGLSTGSVRANARSCTCATSTS